MTRLGVLLVVGCWLTRGLGGWRCVGVLSGTWPGSTAEALVGLAAAACWFVAVLLAPPLLLVGLGTAAARRRPGGTVAFGRASKVV